MTDTEKLEQMLDQIDGMVSKLDKSCWHQRQALKRLRRAGSDISAAIRQAQTNENVDF